MVVSDGLLSLVRRMKSKSPLLLMSFNSPSPLSLAIFCPYTAIFRTKPGNLPTRPPGTFTIAFHFLGYIFSWGVIQAALLEQNLASTRLLSVIGGLATFWNAAGCFPVSSRSSGTEGKLKNSRFPRFDFEPT
jgi:hypothetical protein